MSQDMAPSGNETQSATLETQAFMKGFVAELIARGHSAVHPRDLTDRLGFQSVVDLLDEEADRLQETSEDPDYVGSVVSVANSLRPSNTGAYDGFEAELRALQLTFTRIPNYSYKDIAFTVTEPYARSVIEKLPAKFRDLVGRAAARFIEAQEQG